MDRWWSWQIVSISPGRRIGQQVRFDEIYKIIQDKIWDEIWIPIDIIHRFCLCLCWSLCPFGVFAGMCQGCDRFSLPDELTANIDRCNYNVPTPVQKNLGEKAKTFRLKCCSAFKSALNVRKVLSNCWCYTFKEGVLTYNLVLTEPVGFWHVHFV